MTAIGYAGVVVTTHNRVEGFFISEEAEVVAQAKNCVQQVRHVLASSSSMPAVIDSNPDVAPADQALFGALSALMVEVTVENAFGKAVVLASALHQLAGDPYFCLLARRTAAGTNVQYISLDVDSIEEARSAFNGLPEVIDAKRAARAS